MHVTLKLIGHKIIEDNIKYIYEISLKNIRIISFDVMKTLLTSYGIDDDDINNVNISCDCKNIKNDTIINTPSLNDETKIVYVYSCKEKVREQLEEIFITYGHKKFVQYMGDEPTLLLKEENQEQEEEQEENQEQEEEEELDSTNLDFTEINNEAKKIFENKDFVFLLKTYLDKPELFKTFYKYISSGNILINGKENTQLVSNEEILKSLKIIENLNLGFSNEEIMKALKYTGNHLNLSIRYLLLKKVEENT